MISFQQIRRFVVTMILTIMLTIIIAFDFGTTNSWAATLPNQIATMNRVEAMTKDIEGKAQEAIGNITGDPKDQMMGKAKQVESQARNTAEDIKDKMKLKGRTKAVIKNIEGKAQETIGKATGNRNDQVAGKAKQAESQGRNVVEDVKDAVQNIFN
ncbi:CsbD family protein [Microcystis sp. CS-574]|uniref:CsbD family protein n=1 Tax=Microcystis sp. CS-574 TaxID=3021718 RepID=UPI00232CABA4|nr:CsbD family protein [Microcystis sp. CS-574]MDB9404490.1 CsbD family protein [Microcystis sp. CS-574]